MASRNQENDVGACSFPGNWPNGRSRPFPARNKSVDNHEQVHKILTFTHARKLASLWRFACLVVRAYLFLGVPFRFERGARYPAGRKPWGLSHQNQIARSCPTRR